MRLDMDHPLRFLFIDFNGYFAAVEQHDDPALFGKPVMVIPLPSEHTGAIAASYEAKALGIKRGTTVREARAMCPGIAIRPARHERYVEVHGELMEEIGRHLPVTRVYSIDECACRLSRDEQNAEAAVAKALEVKAGISRNVGPALRSSIGIAASPLLAKLASELEKPDGLQVVHTQSLPDALAKLPLRAIPGIGEGVERRLAKAKVTDFEKLWHLPPKQARAIWGSVVGERFLYALRGHDIPDEAPKAKSMIGHSRVLSPEHQRPPEARIVARALTLKAASRLRLYKLHACRMSLGIALRPRGWLEFESHFPASQNSWTFLRELDVMWVQAVQALQRSGLWKGRMGTVYVNFSDFRTQGRDPDLFAPPGAEAREEKEAFLWAAIDKLNRAYKKQTVTLASQRGLDLNYLGVKIAFSRVPEAAEFLC
ncbi:Y-family DNA polymerase [Allosphingosinicella flava]|nr:type VI secretion protein ImpB [Sphingosinicella flava]